MFSGVIDIFVGTYTGVIEITVGMGGSTTIIVGILIGPIGPISKHGKTIGGKLITADGITKLG